ncbi:hypothetical protein CLOSTMETH_02816 [[Clostridium] methylpentosum DSM 5476]|uniref:Uncharacterized protein n=1 Tax=[Clostridium] methylpentosum DSM 5476 TaxID=537013 RepID=C0EG24_9FIRM|nr:hypothetical protein CLOSTMETH_02816 [[Clostridium] methylpentosum DSM 5476]
MFAKVLQSLKFQIFQKKQGIPVLVSLIDAVFPTVQKSASRCV